MAHFPFGATTPVYVYNLVVPKDAVVFDVTLARFHQALKETVRWYEENELENGQLHKSRVPPSMHFREKELWGWAFPDDENPTSVGRWLVWCIRQWRKR